MLTTGASSGIGAMTDQIGLPTDAIAYAVTQPDTVDIDEAVMRPTVQG